MWWARPLPSRSPWQQSQRGCQVGAWACSLRSRPLLWQEVWGRLHCKAFAAFAELRVTPPAELRPSFLLGPSHGAPPPLLACLHTMRTCTCTHTRARARAHIPHAHSPRSLGQPFAEEEMATAEEGPPEEGPLEEQPFEAEEGPLEEGFLAEGAPEEDMLVTGAEAEEPMVTAPGRCSLAGRELAPRACCPPSAVFAE